MKKEVELLINGKPFLINSKFLRKSRFQESLSDNISQCLTCERRCKIQIGRVGHCQTRVNHNGTNFSIVYGAIIARSINPIEKKPFYHFHPGTKALTIGTYGCNFDCFWCQNHEISHPELDINELMSLNDNYYSPQMMVNDAIKSNCQGTSISFNEPTLLFEYSLEVFKIAHKKGLYNTFVTNGYMTDKVLIDVIESGLDAINIDIKGDPMMVDKFCGVDVEKVWRNARLAKELGVHIEITTLLIDNLNSNDGIITKISSRIQEELGELTPFHITRFFPQYKSSHYEIREPTSLISLEKAYKVAKSSGLKFIYIGNVNQTNYINTHCPNCLNIVIRRNVFNVEEISLDPNGKCRQCGFKISIV